MELAEARAKTAEAERCGTALLSVENVSLRFGGVTALDDVTFRVAPGAICGLIGPNGAGKTTLFNCISRLYDPNAGSIRFEGQSLSGAPRHTIAALGIARTFQNVALFATMSTRDNVRVGAHDLARGGFLANALALPLAGREERRLAERADALIDEFGLQFVADRPVETAVRRAQAGRACPCARRRAEAAAARRTRRRAQSRRSRRAERGNPRHSRSGAGSRSCSSNIT